MYRQPSALDLTRMGIQAFHAGNESQATVLFEQAVERDPSNEIAWTWLAICSEKGYSFSSVREQPPTNNSKPQIA